MNNIGALTCITALANLLIVHCDALDCRQGGLHWEVQSVLNKILFTRSYPLIFFIHTIDEFKTSTYNLEKKHINLSCSCFNRHAYCCTL